MPSRNIQYALVLVAIVAALVIFKRKPPVGPERVADLIITQGVEAIEAGEIDDAMDLVASDFTGHLEEVGSLTKSSLKSFLARLSYLGGGISVTIVSQDFEIGPDDRSVAVMLRVIVVAGGIRGALENNADAREIHLDIELRDDEWLVVSVR
jgi:hypothetical protein